MAKFTASFIKAWPAFTLYIVQCTCTFFKIANSKVRWRPWIKQQQDSTTCSVGYCLELAILHDCKNVEVHSVVFIIMTPDQDASRG